MDEGVRAAKRANQFRELSRKSNDEKSAISLLSQKINALKENKDPLTKEETTELIRLYADAGIEMKQQRDRQAKDSDQYAYYQRMMKKFSKDYTALHKYRNYLNKNENAKAMGMDEFFDKSRTRTVKLPGQELSELDKAGAGQNIRYKVDFKLEDEPVEGLTTGDTVTGYFTENKVYASGPKDAADGIDTVNAKLMISDDAEKEIREYLTKKYPGAKEFIEGPLKNKADVYLYARSPLDTTFRLMDGMFGGIQTMEESIDRMKDVMKRAGSKGDEVLDQIGGNEEKFNAYVEYTSLYLKQSFASRVSGADKIDEKAALGKRNALCSAVAELLGCGNVVAFSEKMKVEAMENGKKVVKQGVLMMPAKGNDPAGCGCNSNFNNIDMLSLENQPGLIKDVASLQLLDYVIGNTDRHNGNYFYQFDKDGKLCGIQGIDNDTSFGAREDLDEVGYGISLQNMRIIPKSMADTINSMKPEALEVVLQGYDLNEKEIENTVSRFKNLQENLKIMEKAYKGTEPGFLDERVPRIVPDQEMEKYSFNEQLAFQTNRGVHSNLFGLIVRQTDPLSGVLRGFSNDAKKLAALSSDVKRDRLDRGPGSLHQAMKELEQAEGFDKKNMKKKGTFEAVVYKTSKLFEKKFSDMQLIDELTELEHERSSIKIYGPTSEYEKYNKALKEALTAANAYLQDVPDAVMDYQTCKAEISMYQAQGDTEQLEEAKKELARLSKDPEVRKYQAAVKTRDKLTEQLGKMEKIYSTSRDMYNGLDVYAEKKRQRDFQRDPYDKQYKPLIKETIRRRNQRNKINDPNAPEVQEAPKVQEAPRVQNPGTARHTQAPAAKEAPKAQNTGTARRTQTSAAKPASGMHR